VGALPAAPGNAGGGRSLTDLFAGRNVDRKAMHEQMKARMDAEGCRTASEA
jgi:hypothetical protein